jgi:hypothetical protein
MTVIPFFVSRMRVSRRFERQSEVATYCTHLLVHPVATSELKQPNIPIPIGVSFHGPAHRDFLEHVERL